MSAWARLFLKFLVAITFIACMGPFTFLKGEDGRPLMTFSQLASGEFSRLTRFFGDFANNFRAAGHDLVTPLPDQEVPVISTDSMDSMYTWVDETGMRNFSYEKPEGVPADQIFVASGGSLSDYESEHQRVTSEGQKVLDEIAAKKQQQDTEGDIVANPMANGGKIPTHVTPENLAQTMQTLQHLQQRAEQQQQPHDDGL